MKGGSPQLAAQPVRPLLDAVLMKARPWLLSQARRMCAHSDAEDLVQDVCLRFTNAFQANPLPDGRSCTAWLATSMHNSFISYLRRMDVRKRAQRDPAYPGYVINLPDPLIPDDGESGGEGQMKEVTDEMLEAAVRALSPKRRAVFEANVEGKSYDEIAELLGITRGAVAKRLHDARHRLRKALERRLAQRPKEHEHERAL
jgi:RNA polymerase sigma-70 factor (ECF subfamily)